jgi:hypothetical protein
MPGHKSLFLHSKNLTAADVPEILEIVSNNEEAQTLVLNNNSLGDDGVTLLVNGLVNHTNIVSLSLRDNQLGDKACEAISQLNHLTDLDLSNNDISDEGLKMDHLNSLDVSGNTRITPKALLDLIQSVNSLIDIEAASTGVSDAAVAAMNVYLKHRQQAPTPASRSGFWQKRGSVAAEAVTKRDLNRIRAIVSQDEENLRQPEMVSNA